MKTNQTTQHCATVALLATLESLMPSVYQRRTWQGLLALFLTPALRSVLSSVSLVSASAASRFLNRYTWPTRAVVRAVRAAQFKLLRDTYARPSRRGARPHLYLLVDLTSVPKTGKTLPYVRSYNRVFGLHLMTLHLSCGSLRFPVGYRVYRGKGQHSPVKLALSLLRCLPKSALEGFVVTVLADSGFESADFLRGVRALGYHAIVGVSENRTLGDGRRVDALYTPGMKVRLANLPEFEVVVSWVRVARVDGKDGVKTFYAMSTRWLSGLQVATLYKHRWLIEIFFKADKHDFGLAKVGCCSELGVNRWVILSFLAYTLSSWARLEASARGTSLIEAARWVLETCLGVVVALLLVAKIEREREVCTRHGLSITVHRCNV